MRKKIVIFTGAGISKESGIPTFRDEEDGLWNNVPVNLVCTPVGLTQNPELVHEFYNELREEMLKKEPNSAHLDCVELEKYYDVTVVTQNVDNLHEKAGSSKVIKIHGDLTKVRAMDNPNLIWECTEPTTPDTEIEGHKIRPHIVFFYEKLVDFDRARKVVKEADIMIVVGTSLQVFPAASLLEDVQYGNPIFYVDQNPGTVPDLCVGDVTEIKKPATQGMKDVLGKLIHYVEKEDGGILYPMDQFKTACETYLSVTEDGTGYYSDGVVVFDDKEVDSCLDETYSHVMWYAK